MSNLIITPAPFDLVKFMDGVFKIIPGEHDPRNDNLTEIDFSKVDFVHCLAKGETSITGEEKLARLKADNRIRYGATVFMGLWNDYQARKEESVLETLYRTEKIDSIDFFGDVLLGPDGDPYVLCLYRGDTNWLRQWNWLGRSWLRERLSAVFRLQC